MIRNKLFLAGALALVVTFIGTPAYTQQPTNQITYFTFSAPFELPGGKVLPAGKYIFQIADSPSNRHIVQVLSEDRQTMHATLLAIPAQRQDPASEPEVRFMETAADAPPAVRTWWYPGRSIGHEFIYPKDHARRLAARQSEGVLTVASDASTTDEMRSAELTRMNKSGQESPVTTAANEQASAARTTPETAAPASAAAGQPTATEPTTTPAPETRTAETTQPAPERMPAPARDAERADAARTRLPQTASPLPLYALLGLGSLLGAGALRLRR